MKKTVGLIFTLFFITSNLKAKELIDGYIILSNNDTVQCKLNVPKSLDVYFKISVEDSLGKKVTYKAEKQEINGFGFIYRDKKYDYVLKTSNDGETAFLLKQILGNKLNLYYRCFFSNSGNGASYRTDVFMLEDVNKMTVTVSGGLFSSYRKKIRLFLKDDPELLKLFEKVVYGITDIPKFINEANGL